jgi:UDP-N-acetylmuramoyl-tripeptide--D-alanyl-D-alanine ligase
MYEGAAYAGNEKMKVYHFGTKEEFYEEIGNVLSDGDIVLVKASHGMHFEEIIKELA